MAQDKAARVQSNRDKADAKKAHDTLTRKLAKSKEDVQKKDLQVESEKAARKKAEQEQVKAVKIARETAESEKAARETAESEKADAKKTHAALILELEELKKALKEKDMQHDTAMQEKDVQHDTALKENRRAARHDHAGERRGAR